jgi:hypothetical protein
MSIFADRARYVPVEQGFNIKRPQIAPQAFVAEMQRAFADRTPTGFVPLDLSETLGTPYPATTPFMLARYVRVQKDESCGCTLAASGEMWAVLRGSGHLRRGDEVSSGARTTCSPFPAACRPSGTRRRTRCCG